MSNNTQRLIRYPALRCWIKHILEGTYLPDEKILFTIFGKYKRVRIYATVLDKKEIISQKIEEKSDLDKTDFNSRLEFDLDDGTGIIRAILWGVVAEQYSHIVKGDLVDVMGIIRQWKNYFSISPEMIKHIENPNFVLLRDAEIIKKLKTTDLMEIPTKIEDNFPIDELSEEYEMNHLFKSDDDKEQVLEKIKELGGEIKGIPFEELQKSLAFNENDLKKYLNELEIESRIYQVEENYYQLI